MVLEALGQRADVHPCTFKREVIWAPSRFAFERVFYAMTFRNKETSNFKFYICETCWLSDIKFVIINSFEINDS